MEVGLNEISRKRCRNYFVVNVIVWLTGTTSLVLITDGNVLLIVIHFIVLRKNYHTVLDQMNLN